MNSLTRWICRVKDSAHLSRHRCLLAELLEIEGSPQDSPFFHQCHRFSEVTAQAPSTFESLSRRKKLGTRSTARKSEQAARQSDGASQREQREYARHCVELKLIGRLTEGRWMKSRQPVDVRRVPARWRAREWRASVGDIVKPQTLKINGVAARYLPRGPVFWVLSRRTATELGFGTIPDARRRTTTAVEGIPLTYGKAWRHGRILRTDLFLSLYSTARSPFRSVVR